MTEYRRGDVVLVSFPFIASGEIRRKPRPAVVVQADRYNARRAVLILAAITTGQTHRHLPCKLPVSADSPEGREAGLRIDSVVDCQTLVTIPREEILRRIGRFPPPTLRRINRALHDALGLPGPSREG